MKHIITCALAATVALGAYGSKTEELTKISSQLKDIAEYSDNCTYEVLLASMAEPVSYTVALQSTAPGDSLSPCDYYICWQIPMPSGVSRGFSAYFDGTHFRFRDKRLQEYHAEWDMGPFAPSGDVVRGVQQQVQFADLLPQYIGQTFAAMAADSTYIYDVKESSFNGTKAIIVEGVRRTSGFDGSEYRYVFDASTMMPMRIELENNPGQIGEQSILVNFKGGNGKGVKIDMESISAAQSEAFEKYREGTYTLESLKDKPLPAITAPRLHGERYHRRKGEPFGSVAVLAFVDADVASTPEVIKSLENAAAMMPMHAEILVAFVNHRVEDIEPIVEEGNDNILINARSAARDCGVGSETPVIIFVDAQGTVKDFVRGFNKDLESIVIQKASLIN